MQELELKKQSAIRPSTNLGLWGHIRAGSSVTSIALPLSLSLPLPLSVSSTVIEDSGVGAASMEAAEVVVVEVVAVEVFGTMSKCQQESTQSLSWRSAPLTSSSGCGKRHFDFLIWVGGYRIWRVCIINHSLCRFLLLSRCLWCLWLRYSYSFRRSFASCLFSGLRRHFSEATNLGLKDWWDWNFAKPSDRPHRDRLWWPNLMGELQRNVFFACSNREVSHQFGRDSDVIGRI